MNKNKAIWLFAGGQMQEAAAKKILDFGYKLILTDINPACICAQYADEFIACDTFDFVQNSAKAEELRTKYDIRAVLTLAADCHETVAIINKQLGLHGISPEISHLCRHKNLTRDVLRRAGINQPRSTFVTNIADARSFLEAIGGTGVIKATDNSASRGFSLLKSTEALNDEVFTTAVLAGTSGGAIIEELLKPRTDCIAELSVETLWFDGKMYWLNWVDRLFRSDLSFLSSIPDYLGDQINWGVEIGHINPAQHDITVRLEIEEMLNAAGLALGMEKQAGGHILKADIMLTETGPVILELTPRLSGGWDSSATSPARGADFQGGVIRLALGESLDLMLWHDHFQFKNPSLYSAILADIQPGAKDCIGRQFSLGCGFERETALRGAYNNLRKHNYVI